MAFLRYWCHHLSKQNLATTNQIYFEKHGIICISYFGSTCNLCRYSTRHVSITSISLYHYQLFLRLTVASQETTDLNNCVVILNNNIVKKALKEYYNHPSILGYHLLSQRLPFCMVDQPSLMSGYTLLATIVKHVIRYSFVFLYGG